MSPREVRILHVITRLDRGGSATNTLLTVAGLGPPFRQSLVFGRTRELPALARALPGTVEVREVAALVRDPAPVRDLRTLFTLLRLMRGGRFDVVHTHTSKAGIIGRLAARLAGVPRIVHTPHGHVFTGYGGRVRRVLFVWLERWAATFTDRIVGLTEREAQDHLERRIGRPEQFVSVHSGVDVARVAETPAQADAVKAGLGLPASARLLGTIGRLEPVKGHRYLVEAFAELAPRFPDLRVALVGDGALGPTLRATARGTGLGDRVLFLGWRDDVPALLQAFDVFVLPSLNEGMGRALVEAMAAGRPIVACRTGGIPEVLDGGEAGLLVEPGSARALARGIETLLLDPTLGARLGKAARERAGVYSVERMLQKLDALYRGLRPFDGGRR